MILDFFNKLILIFFSAIFTTDYQQYYDGDQITFDDQLQLIDNDNNHEIINFDKRINSFGCCETISILSSSPECGKY